MGQDLEGCRDKRVETYNFGSLKYPIYVQVVQMKENYTVVTPYSESGLVIFHTTDANSVDIHLPYRYIQAMPINDGFRAIIEKRVRKDGFPGPVNFNESGRVDDLRYKNYCSFFQTFLERQVN